MPARRLTLLTWIDSLGSVSATLCAVHCALLPLAIALLPVLGLGVLASAGFEQGFVLFATLLGVSSLSQGYRRHRVATALAWLVPGLLAVWAGVYMPLLHESPAGHVIAMATGSTSIATAHLINLKLMCVVMRRRLRENGVTWVLSFPRAHTPAIPDCAGIRRSAGFRYAPLPGVR